MLNNNRDTAVFVTLIKQLRKCLNIRIRQQNKIIIKANDGMFFPSKNDKKILSYIKFCFHQSIELNFIAKLAINKTLTQKTRYYDSGVNSKATANYH